MDRKEDSQLFDLIAGKRLGFGVHRTVFENSFDSRSVLKVANSEDGQHVNILEWSFWNEIEDTVHKKWFAPCIGVSADGKYLLQRRAEPGQRKDYPKMVPHFFFDMKYTNFGFIDGQLVCFDYGTISFIKGFSKKMQKAKWWDL